MTAARFSRPAIQVRSGHRRVPRQLRTGPRCSAAASTSSREPNTKSVPSAWRCRARSLYPTGAIEHMIRAGLAFGAEIPASRKFIARIISIRNLPKRYQISQYDTPSRGGAVEYWREDGTMGRCALEPSISRGIPASRLRGSGARTHTRRPIRGGFQPAGVPRWSASPSRDPQRAGPVASRSPQAHAAAIGVSDARWRRLAGCDANVSIRLAGSGELGTKAEIKNMNSFRSVGRPSRARSTADRRRRVGRPRRARDARWDEARGVTISCAAKSRRRLPVFSDPDLVPMEVSRDGRSLTRDVPERPGSAYALHGRNGF